MRALDRLTKPRAIDRLQQIVDGVHLERLNRVLVVGGDERDEREPILPDQTDDAQAVDFRHLQIEQREIRPLLFDQRDRLRAVLRLADDFHVVTPLQQGREHRARGLPPRLHRQGALRHLAYLQADRYA